MSFWWTIICCIASLQPTKFTRINWDRNSLVKVSAADPGRYCGYARMLQLPDGDLFCVYESSGNIVSVRSKDKGKSWSDRLVIAAKLPGMNMAVPDLLRLSNGDLLVFYNPRPTGKDASLHFGIRVCRSRDLGKHFEQDKLLYEAGTKFQDGCWEPAAVQLPDGSIQLFFANEGPYTRSSEQEISLLQSADNGLHWSLHPAPVSFRKGFRDGMPVPVVDKIKSQTWFAIEDNGSGNFKPILIRSQRGFKWEKTIDGNATDRLQPLVNSLPDSVYAGAPYLSQLPNGQLLLSYQGTEGRTNKMEFAEMKMAIGTAAGNDFTPLDPPFVLPANASGLWGSMMVLDDFTVVALTSTNAYAANRSSEVWMIKGRLRP